ncbi:ATP-grasp domain-containing protein [Xanthobacter sp. TB0139]|uniref:ATP-grasp domain-containing protein n=1 Tax=Xanthobacter sp. TB0139 TaxID=3459178 RepID=UPI00403985A0
MRSIAVAALSARLLAEAARQDGFGVIALDLFGDVDTRRAADDWHDIGTADGSLRLNPHALLDALENARRAGAEGWVAGGGFEAQPDLLAEAATVLPLIGASVETVRLLGNPLEFARSLQKLNMRHPETRADRPDDLAGWLVKERGGTGGRHITMAAHAAHGRVACYQRRLVGRPMSALFVANAERAHIWGWQAQRVQAMDHHPYLYAGAIGPLDLPLSVTGPLAEALNRLVRHFGLVGLGSMDFLLADEAGEAVCHLLEINPRPPATMALYGPGLIRAHIEACLKGCLPQQGTESMPMAMRGHGIVYANNAFTLSSAGAEWLANTCWVHDVPRSGTRFESGLPICSVSAQGCDEPGIEAELTQQIKTLFLQVETP